MTGSGKTEIYLKAIEAALRAGRGALMLVPEIGSDAGGRGTISSSIRRPRRHSALRVSRFRARAGVAAHPLGRSVVVVATRSGVFAPVRNLGLIIVDEEHDQSYKQQETPRYHGRDVAIVRARDAGAVVVLGSATPSLESRYNADRGKYAQLLLPERIESRPMPKVDADRHARGVSGDAQAGDVFARADRRGHGATGERRAVDAAAEPARIFELRRRAAPVASALECANCSVTLTYHRRDRRMLCHYCNYVGARAGAMPEVR